MTRIQGLEDIVTLVEREITMVDPQHQCHDPLCVLCRLKTMIAGLPKEKSVHIVQDWVMGLSLRLQGVLVSAVRGCDTSPRHDHSKVLARIYRGEILRSHAGDPRKSKSFILWATIPDTVEHMQKFLNDCDHFPQHYVMHLIHAAEILGYYHVDLERRDMWKSFYEVTCRKYHLRPETVDELIDRLEKDEEAFHKNQDTTVTPHLYNDRIKKEADDKTVVKVETKLKGEEEERRIRGSWGGS